MQLTNNTKITVKGFVARDSSKYFAILVDYKYWLVIENDFMRLSTRKSACKKFDNVRDATEYAKRLKKFIAECTYECSIEKKIFEPSLHIPIYK